MEKVVLNPALQQIRGNLAGFIIDVDVAYWVNVAKTIDTGEQQSLNLNPLDAWGLAE